MSKCEASWQFPKNLQPKGVLGLPIYEEDQILNKDDLAYFESKRLQMFDKAFWTSPILSKHNLCFPWGVYDAQKAVDEDLDKYMESHSRCSRGTAVCIQLLEMMSEKVQPGSLQDIPPVLSFTSIGEKWSVFMAYRHEGGIVSYCVTFIHTLVRVANNNTSVYRGYGTAISPITGMPYN
jgi:hypothetical protein